MRKIQNRILDEFSRVENRAGERKGVVNDSFPNSQRTAVPTVSGFVRFLKTQKVVTTLIAKCENWVATSTIKPAFSKGFKRRRGYKKSQNLKADFWWFFEQILLDIRKLVWYCVVLTKGGFLMAKRRPNGDGMVRKSKGRWEGRIVVGHKENGDSIFRYVYAKTQKELTEKMHRKLNEYQGVELTEDSKMTLGCWLDIWLEKYMRNTIRSSTFDSYKHMIESYVKPNLGDKIIVFVNSNDIQKIYIKVKKEGRINYHPKLGKSLSDSTIVRLHNMLHKALDDAVKEHLIPKNPTAGAKPPKKPKPELQILNEEQLERFMDAIKDDIMWHDLFYTELTTGLRRGESCGLKWTDFDEKEGILKINRSVSHDKKGGIIEGETKTGQGKRVIILPKSTFDLLKERKQKSHSEWIFENPLKPERPVSPCSAYNRMKTILKDAGLPSIRFHDLRHTFATHALTSGVDAKTLSAIPGHTNASFTLDTYTHVTTDMQKRASEIVDDFVENIFGEGLDLI